MCRNCCKETVYIEIADGVTARVTYNEEDYRYAEKDKSLIEVEVVSLMMTTEKLDELMERI